MSEVWSRLDDHSFIFRSSHKMFRYDVNGALQDYLHPLFDAVHERTAAFPSVLWSQVEMHGKTLRHSASYILLSLDQRLA